MESRQEPGRRKDDGAEETHHRIRKTEDRAEEIRSPKKSRGYRTNRRASRKLRVEAKARSRAGELAFNVRTLAFNGKNGIGYSEVILKVCQKLGCDVIGVQETRRDG